MDVSGQERTELMTHLWVQAPQDFPGTLSRAEDTKLDMTAVLKMHSV